MKKLVLTAAIVAGISSGSAALANSRDCSGEYRIDAGGHSGRLVLREDRGRNSVTGRIDWDDARFGVSRVDGTCDLRRGRSGSIRFSRPDALQEFRGDVRLTERGVSMS